MTSFPFESYFKNFSFIGLLHDPKCLKYDQKDQCSQVGPLPFWKYSRKMREMTSSWSSRSIGSQVFYHLTWFLFRALTLEPLIGNEKNEMIGHSRFLRRNSVTKMMKIAQIWWRTEGQSNYLCRWIWLSHQCIVPGKDMEWKNECTEIQVQRKCIRILEYTIIMFVLFIFKRFVTI